MFPYFGRKHYLARFYGRPRYPLVIEPFAGSMAFSLYHQPRQAIGIEINPRVVELWQRCLTMDLHAPVAPVVGTKTDDLLVNLGACSNCSVTSTTMLVTERMMTVWRQSIGRLRRYRPYARTIDYRLGSFRDAPDVEATWFIDPPYQYVTRDPYGQPYLDYCELAEWVLSRRGQVIVCEQSGADWLPFRPFRPLSTANNKRSQEVVWTTAEDNLPIMHEQLAFALDDDAAA